MVTSLDSEVLTLQEQLYRLLRDRIANGTYQPGDKLPSENELIADQGISRVTVRSALAQLVADGFIVKRQGKGAFVRATTFHESVFSNGSFTDTCLNMGAAPSTRILSASLTHEEHAELAARLNGAEDELELVRIERLRLVDGTPCIIEVDYFPASCAFLIDLDLHDRSLLRVLNEQAGTVASRFTDQFFVARATAAQAEELGCTEGTALLKVEQTVSDASGTPIYINHQFIVTERYVYAVQSSK